MSGLSGCYGKTISYTKLDFSIPFFFKKYSVLFFETHASIIIVFSSGVKPHTFATVLLSLKFNFISESKLDLLSEIFFLLRLFFCVKLKLQFIIQLLIIIFINIFRKLIYIMSNPMYHSFGSIWIIANLLSNISKHPVDMSICNII